MRCSCSQNSGGFPWRCHERRLSICIFAVHSGRVLDSRSHWFCCVQTYPELEVSPPVQAAALVGAGLLYRGTCHRCL